MSGFDFHGGRYSTKPLTAGEFARFEEKLEEWQHRVDERLDHIENQLPSRLVTTLLGSVGGRLVILVAGAIGAFLGVRFGLPFP